MSDAGKWSLDRRRLLQLTTGVGISGLSDDALSTLGSPEEITVTGEIHLHNKDSNADQWVVVYGPDGNEVDSDQFATGEKTFSVTVPAEEPVNYVFYQGNSDTDTYVVFDDNPDVRALGVRKYPNDFDIGRIDLPKGYKLSVRILDENDIPVENASVRVLHEKYTSRGWINGTTTAGGLFKAHPTEPGIEVEGNVTVLAAPSGAENPFSGDSDSVTSNELTVNSDTKVDITLAGAGGTEDSTEDGEGEPESPPFEFENPYVVDVTPIAADQHDALFEINLQINSNYYGDQSSEPQNLAEPLRISTLESNSAIIEAAYRKSQANIGDEIAGDIALGIICAPGGPICDVVEVGGSLLIDYFRNQNQHDENRSVAYFEIAPEFQTLSPEPDPVVYAIHLHSDEPVSNWGTGGDCMSGSGPTTIRYEYDIPDPNEVGNYVTKKESICFDFPTQEH